MNGAKFTKEKIESMGAHDSIFAHYDRIIGVFAPYCEPDALALNLTVWVRDDDDLYETVSNTEVYLNADQCTQAAKVLMECAERIRSNIKDTK